MAVARSIRLISRRDPAVRAIALSWRELTGGTRRGLDGCRRTLIACSGGGDSSGLVLALASALPRGQAAGLFVVGHVVHDLRPRDQALSDRDAAAALAAGLGLPFVEAEVSARRAGGNLEAAARRVRYAALARMAEEQACDFVATAHHAEDQLETVLMGLLRGAGPRGLSGVAPRRTWQEAAERVIIIRPALAVARADLQRLCREAEWSWREDATNADTDRLRAALRHRVLPVLEELRPGAAGRASLSARLITDAARVVDDRVAGLLLIADRSGGGMSWARGVLRAERAIVVGGVLRAAVAELREGDGQDRITGRIVAPAVRAIRGRGTDPCRFEWAGIGVEATAGKVCVRRSSNVGKR